MHHIFEVFILRVPHYGQCKSLLLGAVLLSLVESLPDIQNDVDEYHISVGGFVEVYP